MSTLPTPTLLGLPPELRNAVYRAILISDGPIRLSNRKRHTEPAFLRVCAQIRREAISIYYTPNDFHFTICDWDGLAMRPFLQKRARRTDTSRPGQAQAGKVTVSLCPHDCCNRDHFDFSTLDPWLQAVHHSPDVFPYPTPINRTEQPESWDSIEDMIGMAFATVAASHPRPWEHLEPTLLALGASLITLRVNQEDLAYTAKSLAGATILPARWTFGAMSYLRWIRDRPVLVSFMLIAVVTAYLVLLVRHEGLLSAQTGKGNEWSWPHSCGLAIVSNVVPLVFVACLWLG